MVVEGVDLTVVSELMSLSDLLIAFIPSNHQLVRSLLDIGRFSPLNCQNHFKMRPLEQWVGLT